MFALLIGCFAIEAAGVFFFARFSFSHTVHRLRSTPGPGARRYAVFHHVRETVYGKKHTKIGKHTCRAATRNQNDAYDDNHDDDDDDDDGDRHCAIAAQIFIQQGTAKCSHRDTERKRDRTRMGMDWKSFIVIRSIIVMMINAITLRENRLVNVRLPFAAHTGSVD